MGVTVHVAPSKIFLSHYDETMVDSIMHMQALRGMLTENFDDLKMPLCRFCTSEITKPLPEAETMQHFLIILHFLCGG